MAKRKGKYGPPPEIHERLKQHINCSSRISEAIANRDDWARKGLAWSTAGKIEKAREALKKAQWWDAQRLQWEKKRKALERAPDPWRYAHPPEPPLAVPKPHTRGPEG